MLLFFCGIFHEQLEIKMNFRKLFAVAIIGAVGIVATLGSTTVPKEWTATGGSRADGTVKLSYEIGGLETAQLDDGQALKIASERCKVWGYTGAQPFGGVIRQCNAASGYGCYQWIVSKEFQCVGFEEFKDNEKRPKSKAQ